MSFPKEKINEFWALKRVAVVGVLRAHRRISPAVYFAS